MRRLAQGAAAERDTRIALSVTEVSSAGALRDLLSPSPGQLLEVQEVRAAALEPTYRPRMRSHSVCALPHWRFAPC